MSGGLSMAVDTAEPAGEGAMAGVMRGLLGLGVARLAALGVIAIAVFGLIALLALRGAAPPGDVLYANIDLRDTAQMTQVLDEAHIAYRTDEQGTRIMVSSTDVARARLLLARKGLPNGGTVGYEIFDHTNALTETSFQQRINETRALEGELARTIEAISGVRSARVNLVLPRREPFSRTEQKARASVLLSMVGAARMDRENVQAVLNLVAAAVPGLQPERIAIVDSRGDLLARAGQPGDISEMAQTAQELKRATELRLQRGVEALLERTLGVDHVRAEATVTLNLDKVQETQEQFDPNQQVIRSQQTNSVKRHSTNKADSVSVQNSLPNGNTGAGSTGQTSSHREETTNYEIGKTTRTLIRDQPQIARLSIAVMVDGTSSRDAKGRMVWHPRTPKELAQIAQLVKTAVGYDAKRGDRVDVVSMPFVDTDQKLPPPPAGPFGLHMPSPQLFHLAETGLIGIVTLLALVLVARPVALRLVALPAGGQPGQRDAALDSLRSESAAALTGAESPAGLLETENLVNVANIEGQMKASSLRRIGQLADRHPDETLAILRGWMLQGDGR